MRVRCEERFFDVEPVLQEDEGGVCIVFGESGADEVNYGGRDVGCVFGGEEDVGVGREGFLSEVRDGVADCVGWWLVWSRDC